MTGRQPALGAKKSPNPRLRKENKGRGAQYYGPLRGHGFDMDMIFANGPHARTLAWVISFRKISFSESRATPDMGVVPMSG